MVHKIAIEERNIKENLKGLRNQGKLPAVYYGRKEKSTPVTVNTGDFKKLLKEVGESTVVTLKTEKKNIDVLIHDISYEPVHGDLVHVDFYAIETDKPVEVNVSLNFVGVAPAEKEQGGVLVKVLHEILIKGLPKDLPQMIEVDLGALKTMDDSISIENLSLPSGIKFAGNPKDVVVSITTAVEEKEEETTFDADSVLVESKGKEESETAEGEENKEKKES